jgi:hypothetical protein
VLANPVSIPVVAPAMRGDGIAPRRKINQNESAAGMA